MCEALQGFIKLCALLATLILGSIYTIAGLYAGWDTWWVGMILLAASMIIGRTIKSAKKKDKKENASEVDAVEILKTRYAKGEITKEEYEQMKKDLAG